MSQSVARALQLLKALEQAPHSLDELATLVGVHKTTVLRLLRTLEDDRLVTHDDHHRYRLGSGLFELANSALERLDVRSIAKPELAALNTTTGQTVHLAAREGAEVIYIDKLDALQGVRMYSRVGLRASLYCTAVAKVLLAALPRGERTQIAASIDYLPLTPNTIRSAPAFLAELDCVADAGFAEDHEEHEAFINCVAAPVRDGSGAVVAAVSVSVPLQSLDHDGVLALAPRVRETANAISTRLGWQPTNRKAPMTDKIRVATTNAPAPAHTFSQGIRRGNFVQVSGQGPVDPATGEYLFPGDVAAQTTRTLDNVKAIVEASGASFDDVVMLRVYLTRRDDFAIMNEAYGAFVAEHVPSGVLPSRTTVFTGLPREEMLVEIDGIAITG